MLKIIKDIFFNPRYALLFFTVSVSAFLTLVLVLNVNLIFSILSYSAMDVWTKVKTVASLVLSIHTNFSIFSAFSIILISFLVAANVTAMLYIARRFKGSFRWYGTPAAAGTVSAILGGGCAACGTLVISPFLYYIGAGWILALLPLGGQELNIFAIILLTFSLWRMLKEAYALNNNQ